MKQHYTNPKIHKAYHALRALSEDEQARLRAEMRERALRNEVSELNAARLEGRLGEVVDSVIKILRIRFNEVPEPTKKRLSAISELDTLHALQDKALKANSLEEFETHISSPGEAR